MRNKEYCGDCLYDDIYAAFHPIDRKLAYDRTGELIRKIQPPMEKIREERDQALKKLKTAIKYLREGKKMFIPHTTNSFIDDFLKEHEDVSL